MAAAGTVEFVLKARDEATRELQRVSGELGGMSSAVGRLSSGLGALGIGATTIAAVGAAAFTAAKGFADFAETLDRNAKLAGTSAENMQALKLAFEQAGLAGEDAVHAMGFLAKAIGDNDPMLKRLGITTRDVFAAFQQLGGILDKTTDAGERANIAQTLLGRSMKENAGIMGWLARQTGENVATLKQFRAGMDDAAEAAGLRLDQGLDDLNTRLVASATALQIKVAPALIEFIDLLNKSFDAAAKLAPQAEKLGEKLAGLAFKALPLPLQAVVRATGAVVDAALTKNPGEDISRGQRFVHGGATPRDWGSRPVSPAEVAQNMAASWGMIRTQTEGKQLGLRTGDAADAIDKLTKNMKEMDVVATQTGESMTPLSRALRSMQVQVAGSISMAVDAVVRGGMSISAAFKALMTDIVQTVAASLAKLGIGLGLEALGYATGQTWLVPIGRSVQGSAMTAGPTGGDTYVIQTLDSKTITDAIISPSGSWRRANARVREIALAGAM